MTEIETDDKEVHRMLADLELDGWYFFRSVKSASYWAKRRTPYSDKVSEPWTFADTPEQVIKQAHKALRRGRRQ